MELVKEAPPDKSHKAASLDATVGPEKRLALRRTERKSGCGGFSSNVWNCTQGDWLSYIGPRI